MPIRQVLSNFTFEQQRLMINNIGNDIGDLSGLPPTFSGKTLKDCFGTIYSGNTGITSVLYSPTMFSVAISGGTATNTSIGLSTLSNSQVNNPTIENGTYTNTQTYYGRITIASGTPQGGTRVTLDNRGDFFGVSLAVSSGVFNIFTTTSGHPLSLGAFNGPTVILNPFGNLVVSGNTNIVGSIEANSITVASGIINTPTISGGVINNAAVNNPNIKNITLSGGTLTDLTSLNFSATSGTFSNITSTTPQLNSPSVSSGTFNFSTFTNCSAAGLTATAGNYLNPFISSGIFILPTISGGLLGAVTVVSGTAINLTVSSGTQSTVVVNASQINSPTVSSGTFILSQINSPTVSSGTTTNTTLVAPQINSPTVSSGTTTNTTLNTPQINSPTVTSGTFSVPTINGPVFNATNVTGTVTLGNNADYAFLTASSGYTVTLPSPVAALAGKPITLVRTDSTANTIAIVGHINGSAGTTNTSVFFASQVNRRFMAVCNGTSWWVTGMTATSGVTTLTTT